MRPLDFLGSIKAKLGVVIVAAVLVTVVVINVGVGSGASLIITALVALVLALLMVQVLARGMTSPLREMADAAQEMAAGNYGRTVQATSKDEVGDLARAFNAMAEELAETDRIRRDLVANVSHELRTPISGLQAMLENLVDGVARPDSTTLETMLAQTERLGRLVAELLDLSRLESGAVPLNASPTSMAGLLRQCTSEFALTHPDADVLVRVDDGLVGIIDGERMHQVIINLLANAAGVSHDIELVAVAHNQTLVIEVADKGPGVTPMIAQRMFERFYRADTARATGGAGLGLAIVKGIVDLHGGSIVPESPLAGGCRMVITLPARVDDSEGQVRACR